jgi:hypothetical protein
MGQSVTNRLLKLKDNLHGWADNVPQKVLRDRACRRLLWIAWVIQNAGQDPAIRVFRQPRRQGDKIWALWLFEHDYAVILAERSGYYLLKTAFLVTKEHKREELDRDWQVSQTPPKS